MSPRNAGVFCLCRSVIHLDLKKTETDQPVRLGPDRRFPTIKTGGFPLSRQRDIPSSGHISPRPNRLTETKTSHSRTVGGWIRSEPSNFPAIGGKTGFRPELVGDQIPLIRGIYRDQAAVGHFR